MKKKYIIDFDFILLLVADEWIEDLWSDYQGEVFVYKSILDNAKDDSCHYFNVEGAPYDLIKQDFLDDLKLEGKLAFNTAFEFRDMKINFTGIETRSTLDNRYHGQDVFLLAVELERLSEINSICLHIKHLNLKGKKVQISHSTLIRSFKITKNS